MDGRRPRPWQDRMGLETLLAFAAMVVAGGVGGHGRRTVDSGSAAVAEAAARKPAAPRSLAADPPLIEPAAWIGGPITSLAPAGDLVWLAQGQRVWAVDLADPDGTRDLGPGLRFEGEVDALAVDGTLGLVAVGEELWALNLADARAPRRGGRLMLERPPGTAKAVKVERILLYRNVAFLRQAGRADDIVVDLKRPASPRLMPASPLNLPAGTVIGGFLPVGDVVVVKTDEPVSPSGVGSRVNRLRLFDRRLAAPVKPLGRVEVAAATWGLRDDIGAERLVSIDTAPGTPGFLELLVWDLADPKAPRVMERHQIPAPSIEQCNSLDGNSSGQAGYTRDGKLYMGCSIHRGTFHWGGVLLRWDPSGTVAGNAWQDVAQTLTPLDHDIVAWGDRALTVNDEGVLVYHSRLDVDSRLALVQSAVGLVADRNAGRPTLLVNSGGMRRLSLARVLDPVLQGSIAFGGGETTQVTVGDGVAAIDYLGFHDLHSLEIWVADLGDLESARGTGSIDLRDAPGSPIPIVMAQSGRILAVVAGKDRTDLYRLNPDEAPRKVGSATSPGGTLVALAMSGNLLATLSLESRPSTRGAMSPLTLALFRVDELGNTAHATLIGQRMLAAQASARSMAPSLLMTPDRLVVSMEIGCGSQGGQGVMLLSTAEITSADSLYPLAWLPGAGRALLLLDGYLFVRGSSSQAGIEILDIRQASDSFWSWRMVGSLAVVQPVAMTALDHTVYVSMGDAGVAIFQPDLPWASDSAAPTPTAPPDPPPFTPTQPSTPCLSPTPTATASATASPSRTPAATATVRGSATPTRAPGRRLWLPLVGAG